MPPPKTEAEKQAFQDQLAAESIHAAIALARADMRLRNQEERIRAIEFERRVLGR